MPILCWWPLTWGRGIGGIDTNMTTRHGISLFRFNHTCWDTQMTAILDPWRSNLFPNMILHLWLLMQNYIKWKGQTFNMLWALNSIKLKRWKGYFYFQKMENLGNIPEEIFHYKNMSKPQWSKISSISYFHFLFKPFFQLKSKISWSEC